MTTQSEMLCLPTLKPRPLCRYDRLCRIYYQSWLAQADLSGIERDLLVDAVDDANNELSWAFIHGRTIHRYARKPEPTQ